MAGGVSLLKKEDIMMRFHAVYKTGAVVKFQNPTLTVEEAGDPFMICVELSNETSLLQRPVGVIVTFESG